MRYNAGLTTFVTTFLVGFLLAEFCEKCGGKIVTKEKGVDLDISDFELFECIGMGYKGTMISDAYHS